MDKQGEIMSLSEGAGSIYKVVLRTTTRPHSAIVAGAIVVGGVIGGAMAGATSVNIIDELWAYAKHRHQTETERSELCVKLFREIQNADFVVGARWSQKDPDNPWAYSDVKASFNMLNGATGIFTDVAEPTDVHMTGDLHIDESGSMTKVPILKDDEVIDPKRNHIFFCENNLFVRWILGREEKPPVSGLRQDRRDKLLEQIPYNFCEIENETCICKGDEEIFRPIWNESLSSDDSSGLYDRDYLMILKIPGIFESAKFNIDFVVAGCHGGSTEAIGLVMQDEDILSKIVDNIGTARYFQAIIEVDMGLRRESKYAELRAKIKRFITNKDYNYQPLFEPDTVRYIAAKPLTVF